MSALENRVPPLLVVGLIALLMSLAASKLPDIELAWTARLTFALSVLFLGLGVCLFGVLSFRRACTTVNPLQPQQASELVEAGIYRYSRNPMYLGFAIILTAWALILVSPLALLGVVVFVLYMNRFQIAPEERALEALFGESFVRYRVRVRRWI
ncbi:isoprenylcysteine carboxyl methyltransferase [Pseudomonas saudimassiliensis]|uniref:Isoprenylcysteine carboxyl methyltransferase n=1 Tax=Pseudomonas saudimassiliensis TaxID=1461581 RepID=A0A078MGX0_9PSED|nr:isoprenylcysteine carboxylmethyltransferase family protein [Pseudomonas saudimassiliensis]CEA03946.1 isoprenylcysteine carboxyl methyltransferase [Pseudomonas saudimassiliensis]CEF26357.1 isoprenylcysteine carboxyl methyltransferase [Pseudomonas saudimassiliensis]